MQEYDRHLGAVNTITFVDENRRFVSTSDDKSMRVWEWDIPVDMKYIADPTMHSMPAVTLSPNGKNAIERIKIWIRGLNASLEIRMQAENLIES